MTQPRIQLQLYRTLGTGPPESLKPGELAFSEGDRQLYVGLADGTIYTFPFLALAQVLGSDRDFSTLVNLPTSLSGHNITLTLADIPSGIDYQTLQNRPDVSALDELLDFASLASFPATGESGKLYIALDTGLFYRWAAGQYHQLTGRTAQWGEIVGNIEDQGDLKARLDTLQNQIDSLTLAVENQKIKVGDLYFSTDAADPAVKLGYGTWAAYAEGRAIVGVDSGDPDFATAGATTGAKTHTLAQSELPSHSHTIGSNNAGPGGFNPWTWINAPGGSVAITSRSSLATTAAGGNQPHNNIQPSIAVYCWRRTA